MEFAKAIAWISTAVAVIIGMKITESPWSTFLTHNETSKCSKFLSPIKRSVVKIYLLSSL